MWFPIPNYQPDYGILQLHVLPRPLAVIWNDMCTSYIVMREREGGGGGGGGGGETGECVRGVLGWSQ